MDVENPMVNDAYWHDDEEEEKVDQREEFCRKADEEYDGRFD